MNKKKIATVIICVVCAMFFAGLLYYANYDRPHYTITDDSGTEYETARVLNVIEDNTTVDEENENILRGSEVIEIELLTGRYKGDTVTVTNYFGAVNNVIVGEGDKLTVRIDTLGVGEYEVSVYNYHRTTLILWIVALFLLTLMLIGGRRGVKAVAGLIFTLVCIVFILVPMCLKGYSPVLVTCFVILITNLACYALLGGLSTKTVTACAGSMCGVLMAALLAYLAQTLAGVTTFQMDEAEALLLVKSEYPLQMRGLFISGILIASMGAVMDISMDIASALDELHRHNPKLTARELFASGMNIGRDVMGTNANTLVLAFAGSSLNMMILIYSYGVSFTQLVNTDFVAIEVIRAVAGSMGIVLTVPVVAAISALAYQDRKKSKKRR